jgi:hypothetical protein
LKWLDKKDKNVNTIKIGGDIMFLYHYFENERKPFLSLSDLSDEEAIRIHKTLEKDNNIFSKRNSDGKYMELRHLVENQLYSKFTEKGGKAKRKTPYYMVLGESNFYKSLYNDGYNGVIKISLEKIDKNAISFTYGDSFITFISSTYGGTEWYLNNVYMYDEIQEIIKKYGMPVWTKDTLFYQPGYVEAQIWDEEIIKEYTIKRIE